MITVLFYLSGKEGKEAQLRELLGEMTRVSRAEDQAVSYVFMQQRDHRSEWALFEQWRDRAHLDAHVASMKQHFGEPPPGARLPARLHELTASCRAQFYHVLA